MNSPLGVIGLGNLGCPLAQNLLKDGYTVRVYNRTTSRADGLTQAGALRAETPAEAAEPGSIVFTVLSDDRALEEVALHDNALAERLGPGGIHVSVSTIAPETANRIAEHHARFGAAYVAAPVFARPEAMAARRGWFCLAGEEEACARVRPLLEAMSQKVFEFGTTPGAANVAKLAGNFLIASALEAMAEAFTLAEKSGVERAAIYDLVSSTMFACPIYQNYGRMIAAQSYTENVGFRLPLGLKDVNLVHQTATQNHAPMPLANLLHDRLVSAMAKGREDWDWTGLAQGASDDAGLGSQD